MDRMIGRKNRAIWDDDREHTTKGKRQARRSAKRTERQEWHREAMASV